MSHDPRTVPQVIVPDTTVQTAMQAVDAAVTASRAALTTIGDTNLKDTHVATAVRAAYNMLRMALDMLKDAPKQ